MNYLDEAVTKSLDDFMEYYKVVDTEEIYSNGIELVPIFRVKQWEEYNNKDKEIERLTKRLEESQLAFLQVDKDKQRLNNIIKRLEEDLREMYLSFGEFSEEYTENKIRELKGENNE